jgi:CubicO group peptidase (beta-lactamase class C family)
MHSIIIITVLILPGCEKDDDNPIIVTDAESLTMRLNQILEESEFPGFTIGIVKDGNAAYQKSFGFRNIENNIYYTNQTIQPIGSVSKTFIAAAVVKSIELGYFTLETPINDILSEPIVNPLNPSAEVRVKHLVSHSSGLIDMEETLNKSYYILSNQNTSTPGAQLMQFFGIVQRTPKSLKEFIKAYYYEGGDYYSPDNFSNSEPGEVESYTNAGAALIAYIIEEVSGSSYQEFVQTHIFNKLGMNNTSYKYELPNSHYASLYFDNTIPLPYYDFESFPDGGVKTSNEDLMKYLINMIKGQRGESNTLFSKEYYDLLYTKTCGNYSIFWYIENGIDAFCHDGGDPGLTTEFHFSGSSNSGFFILSNYDTSTDAHSKHFYETYGQILNSISEFLAS